jgi:alkylation response protein AidB-like acyl-CoA dehydrogenase
MTIMSQYHPPLRDIEFLLKHVFPISEHAQRCGSEIDADTALMIAGEAGKLAAGKLDAINRIGDQTGSTLDGVDVTTPPGFKEAYREFAEGGWNGLKFPEEFGGQALPAAVSTVVDEMWHAANLSFALNPMLTNGAIEALLTAGSDALKQTYLPKLVSGEWTGTMNLTEPQAGSDLAAVATKAVRQADGSYRITGQKIFITHGEHDFTDNIIHLVLARTPDAPKGVKGISLFVVPKMLVGSDGALQGRNDLRCASLEHKLGIHASPTAVMSFGENGGATGYLVGEENRGLEYMFIMMNEARFAVGLQGLAVSERAYQHALWYAGERVQGRAVGEDGSLGKTILRHPDVRRLLLSTKSRIEAMRALAVYVAMQKDLAHAPLDEETRRLAKDRAELLVPVLKGWLTETAQITTYDALQVFGGMGFIEETGAAQYYRDARILTIYEGTTAIQANDLIGRKTARDNGKTAGLLLDAMDATVSQLEASGSGAGQELAAHLRRGCAALREAVQWVVGASADNPRAAYAGSVPYLELWGIVAGGWMQALRLQAAQRAGLQAEQLAAAEASAKFFATHVLAQAPGLASTVTQGASGTLEFPDAMWA